jgi:hypothetical protein
MTMRKFRLRQAAALLPMLLCAPVLDLFWRGKSR